jgi:hypothetical protein
MTQSGHFVCYQKRTDSKATDRERKGCAGYFTPAMAACATDRLWEASDLVALLEADERALERAA